ncbi:hypothetical protein JXM67_14900 [candidate division WOR-3 bacterium]|nr:hypothetical protein [candidate division WOR-3 bacterium]
MKLYESLIIAVSIIAIPLSMQGWTRTYGGQNNDVGKFVQQTADGGYIICGWNDATGYFGYGWGNIWVIKTNSKGDTLWTREYRKENHNYGECVRQTEDGGYLVLGRTMTDAGDIRIWLLRLNSYGDTMWSRLYGDEMDYHGFSLINSDDSGCVIAGSADYEMLLFKIDSSGDVLWESIYPGYSSHSFDFDKTTDGGYIMVGKRNTSTTGLDLYLIKADSLGELSWTRFIGGEDDEMGFAIKQLSDRGYIVTGGINLFWPPLANEQVDGDLWLLRLDSTGDTLWTRTYGEGDSTNNCGRGVLQAKDGGFVVVGYKENKGSTGSDLWLLETDSLGDTLWSCTFGGDLSDKGYYIISIKGGYSITGASQPEGDLYHDLYLITVNEFGDTVWYFVPPVTVGLPLQDTIVDTIIPAAWFRNLGTMGTVENFYCHCEIVPKGSAYLSPPYHVKYWISYSLEPGDSVYVEFAEWFADDSARYEARFYTTKEDELIWTTDTVTIEFQGVPDVGIIENPIVFAPSWELTRALGHEISLQYSNYPKGFRAEVFDASGRRVDVLQSSAKSGTVTWGEDLSCGVYFIRVPGAQTEVKRRVVIIQ